MERIPYVRGEEYFTLYAINMSLASQNNHLDQVLNMFSKECITTGFICFQNVSESCLSNDAAVTSTVFSNFESTSLTW